MPGLTEETPTFGADDIDILDLALMRNPELRVCAWAVKQARATGLKYPVLGPTGLFSLHPSEEVAVAGHRITRDAVIRHMPPEFFPITNEAELIDRVHIALVRCRYETARRVIHGQEFTAILYGAAGSKAVNREGAGDDRPSRS